MRVEKYLHSCLVLIEGGKRLALDPGAFSFVEEKLRPEDLGVLDAILLTHEHPDHYDPEALKAITQNRAPKLITHETLHKRLEAEGIPSLVIGEGDRLEEGVFTIEAIRALHGALPIAVPFNLGYLISGTLFHPGDSLDFSLPENPRALALPIAAPWLTLKDALAVALCIKPQYVIPIHDAIIKDFMLERIYGMCEKVLTQAGIGFIPLKLGQSLDLD